MTAQQRFRFAGLLTLLTLVMACGSASTTVTSPASADRCAITLNTGATSVPATGGSGTVGVTATRECAWSAVVEGTWLSIHSGASGQGEGTVAFAATPNPDPQVRSGAIVVNGSRAQVTQAAGTCVVTLAESSANMPPAGGSVQIGVRATSALCAWTATVDVPWISITGGGNGRGNGTVGITVAATTGPPRTGSVTIAGQQFSVTQSQGCTYSIDRPSQNVSSAGGSGTLAVTTTAACPWTSASNVEWIGVTPGSGSGPGVVSFSVAATQGPERIGTVVVAGQLFTVTQSPGCAYDVQPRAHTVPAAGGTAAIVIATTQGCGWAASSNVPWITIQGATTGNGPGQLSFSVAATTGAARTGILSLAGQQVTVTQTQGCTFAISPQSQTVQASGGSGKVTVTAGAGCSWTATSGAPWVTIASGATGTGNGDVQFTVAATSGPARSAALTIAGQIFTLTQGEGCAVTLAADRADLPASGGTGSVSLLSATGCSWAATSNAPWLTITSGANGSGNGAVNFSAAANAGPSRQGTLTIAGLIFTVIQAGGCTYSITPASTTIGAPGGQFEVDVTSGGGCAWTAESKADWITVTMGATGNNNGKVRLTVSPNNGTERSGSVAIAGHTHTVIQATGCSFTVTPEVIADVPAAGETRRLEVNAPAACVWTATSTDPWITVPQNAGGSGNGGVDVTIAPNSNSQARTGSVTIAGRQVAVSQQGAPSPPPPCVITLTPSSQPVPLGGGTGSFAVSASAGCPWTATTQEPWISITSGASGTGDGVVQFSVAPAAAARTGTIVVNGQAFTINQQ